MPRTPLYDVPMDTATVRVPSASWAELHDVAGDYRPEVVRQLIEAYLHGAPMPAKPPIRRPHKPRRRSALAAAAARAATTPASTEA